MFRANECQRLHVVVNINRDSPEENKYADKDIHAHYGHCKQIHTCTNNVYPLTTWCKMLEIGTSNMSELPSKSFLRKGKTGRRSLLVVDYRCVWLVFAISFSPKQGGAFIRSPVAGDKMLHLHLPRTAPSVHAKRKYDGRSPGNDRSGNRVERQSSSARGRITNSTSEYNFWDDKLSINAFNMDLRNLALDDVEKAEDAIDIMEDLCREQPDNPFVVRPDSTSYTIAIEGWCSRDHDQAAVRAQNLLNEMHRAQHLIPNELAHILVCQKWAESSRLDNTGSNAQRANDVLSQARTTNQLPSAKLYSIVLDGWCRCAGKVQHAMSRAEALLSEMEELSFIGGGIRPNVIIYTNILGGLAKTKDRDLARRADEVLIRMKVHGVEPDMVAYTSVINCWAKACSREERERAATRAMELLASMENAYVQERNYNMKPNAITYAATIRAIGNSFHPDAPALSENLLRRMYNLTESGTIHVPPNVGTYNAVIASLSSGTVRSNRLERAKRAEQLLLEMSMRSWVDGNAVHPNVATWGAVLRAWSESGRRDSGKQAQRVLRQLQTWHEEGKTTVRPNVVCYTTVINAWGRGNAPPKVTLNRIQTLLNKMETLYEETLDPDIRPNKITYVTAIDAICKKCKDKAAPHAQAIVDRMLRLYSKGIGFVRPTKIVFNALINAWSRSSDPDGAVNAERIFRWMETQYRGGDNFVRPDAVTVSGVLNAWANNAEDGGALRAQEILDHIESLSLEERGFVTSVVFHNILIKAWGRSRAPDNVERAESILIDLEKRRQMGRADIRPDVTTFSSVINCCAYYSGDVEGRKRAFDVALRTFRKLHDGKNGEVPNHISYGTLFKAISRLTPADSSTREMMVAKYFKLCCQEGQVDSFVISQVRAASNFGLYRKLILEPTGLNEKDENDIEKINKNTPPEWGKNVPSY